jgi:hypothetical protein
VFVIFFVIVLLADYFCSLGFIFGHVTSDTENTNHSQSETNEDEEDPPVQKKIQKIECQQNEESSQQEKNKNEQHEQIQNVKQIKNEKIEVLETDNCQNKFADVSENDIEERDSTENSSKDDTHQDVNHEESPNVKKRKHISAELLHQKNALKNSKDDTLISELSTHCIADMEKHAFDTVETNDLMNPYDKKEITVDHPESYSRSYEKDEFASMRTVSLLSSVIKEGDKLTVKPKCSSRWANGNVVSQNPLTFLLDKQAKHENPWKINLDTWDIEFTKEQDMKLQDMNKKMILEKTPTFSVDRITISVAPPSTDDSWPESLNYTPPSTSRSLGYYETNDFTNIKEENFSYDENPVINAALKNVGFIFSHENFEEDSTGSNT